MGFLLTLNVIFLHWLLFSEIYFPDISPSQFFPPFSSLRGYVYYSVFLCTTYCGGGDPVPRSVNRWQ